MPSPRTERRECHRLSDLQRDRRPGLIQFSKSASGSPAANQSTQRRLAVHPAGLAYFANAQRRADTAETASRWPSPSVPAYPIAEQSSLPAANSPPLISQRPAVSCPTHAPTAASSPVPPTHHPS